MGVSYLPCSVSPTRPIIRVLSLRRHLARMKSPKFIIMTNRIFGFRSKAWLEIFGGLNKGRIATIRKYVFKEKAHVAPSQPIYWSSLHLDFGHFRGYYGVISEYLEHNIIVQKVVLGIWPTKPRQFYLIGSILFGN